MSTKWEYKQEEIFPNSTWRGKTPTPSTVTDRLDELGADGWEMCGLHVRPQTSTVQLEYVVLLKRPIEEEEDDTIEDLGPSRGSFTLPDFSAGLREEPTP